MSHAHLRYLNKAAHQAADTRGENAAQPSATDGPLRQVKFGVMHELAPAGEHAELPDPNENTCAAGESPTGLQIVERRAMIAQAAYFKAQARGFAAGFEQADWFEAERELRHQG